MTVLALDLGGTHMRAALVSDTGEVGVRRERPTPHTGGIEPLIEHLREVAASGPGVECAVVGVPGRVDYQRGALERAPNLPPGWETAIDEASLREALGMDVAIANDADLAAVGEAHFGAGRAFKDVAYMTVSTGVGAGVVAGGLLLHGRRSLAELGHSIIDWRALDGRSTVEQLGSGSALTTIALERGLGIPGPEVHARAVAGDAAAAALWDSVVLAVAVGAVNLAQLFTPEVIVIGGGVGLVGEPMLEPVRQLLAVHGPARLPEPIQVVGASLGDDAGLAGAGAWSRSFQPEAASR